METKGKFIKMRVLLISNIVLPDIAEKFSESKVSTGGWLSGMLQQLKNCKNVEIAVAFPLSNSLSCKTIIDNGFRYYGFPQSIPNSQIYNPEIEKYMMNILDDYKPDILHVFGTEFPHSLTAVKVFNNPQKSIISIQGLCSIIAQHYYSNVPINVVNMWTFRDLIKNDNIKQQKNKFIKRGKFEIEAINRVGNIIGRTTWDRACTSQINPEAEYYFCNEILREEFYKHKWNLNDCERYSIFISQGSYTIKGLHNMLKAMPLIIEKFPDTILYIAGTDITKSSTLKEKIKLSSYGKYIRDMIKSSGIHSNVIFTGPLNEQQMCEQFLKAHVFVSPSSIENESNSLSEAKILGVPSVASYVGGVTDRINHNDDGFIYQHDAPYMLAYFVCEIFEKDDLAISLSINARNNALKIHDRENNTKNMINIYQDILNKEEHLC